MLLNSGSSISTKTESKTGYAVTYDSPTASTNISDIGFTTSISEMWCRFDVYEYGGYGKINFYFSSDESNSKSVRINLFSSYSYFGDKSIIPEITSFSSMLYTFKVHITNKSLTIYRNDLLLYSYTADNVLDVSLQKIKIITDNSRISNIIIADYDCTNETLATEDKYSIASTFDLSRNISNNESVKFDLSRTVTDAQTISAKFDLSRVVSKSVSESFDLKRIVSSSNFHLTESFDLTRNVSHTVSEKFDLIRTIPSNNAITFDLKRSVYTKKSFIFDLKRSVYKTISEKYDTKRIIPYSLDNIRIQSVTLSLQENTLTDHMSFDVAGELHPFDVMRGTFMDFPYRFTIDSTSQQDLIQTCNSMYDFDDILTRYYKYSIQSAVAGGVIKASMHAEKIAAALGLTSVCKFDDFQPENNYNLTDVTYSNLVSSIFGWTTRLPRRQINIFMRGNKLYFLQRGNESNTVDITSIAHSRPTIQREIVRSIDRINIPPQGMGLQAGTMAYVDPKFFDGQVGDVSYSEGLATSSDGNGRSITYEYNGSKQVSSKIISNSDGSTVKIGYKYSNTSGGSFLSEQTETHISSSGNSSSKTTTYDTLGNGYVSATVHTGDGEYVGSSISMGGGNGEINGSTMNDVQSALGAQWNDGGDDVGGNKTEIGWPVSDRDTMEKILSEICWIYHSIKEQVNVDIQCRVVDSVPEYTHVIDFTDKVVLDGNTYYLQSNTVKRDTKSLTQSLQLVRWYGGGTVSDKSDFVVNKEYSEV